MGDGARRLWRWTARISGVGSHGGRARLQNRVAGPDDAKMADMAKIAKISQRAAKAVRKLLRSVRDVTESARAL